MGYVYVAEAFVKDYGTKPLWDFIVDRAERCCQEVWPCN
jgi:hypothetical protein